MRHSLERRLALALLAFGSALAITYGIVVPQVAFKTEDKVLLRLSAQQLVRLERDKNALLPAPMFRVSERSDLQPQLAARLLALPVGVHELNDVALTAGAHETDLMVAVAESGAANRIACHDVAALEAFDERIDAPGYYALILSGTIASLALTALGVLTSRRIFRSLRSLGRMIEQPDTAQARTMLNGFDDDEIGRLAKRAVDAREDLDQALIRERHFTRDASHELRTPVAIAAGALELLEREVSATPRVAELCQRMRSAHQRIEELVVAFLWLARSGQPESESTQEPTRLVLERVRETIEQHQGQPLPQITIAENEPQFLAHVPPLADIVLRNLLHNAVRHGDRSEIAVTIGNGWISIANTGPDGTNPSTREHGFGQSIVADLCRRLGWQVTFQHGNGTYEVRLRTRSTEV